MAKRRSIKRSTIKQAAQRLQRFLDSGQVRLYLKLLCGKGQHIVICEESGDGGFGCVYFVDRNGLQRSTEAMGLWTAYSKNVPPPSINHCTVQEVAAAYARLQGDPRRIVGRLKQALGQRFTQTLSEV